MHPILPAVFPPVLPLLRRVAIALAVVATGLLQAAPLQTQAGAQKTVLRIGIGLAKPPYIMEPDGVLPGIEYEIAERALAASGYLMQAEQLPPARALALLRAGHLDGMLSVTEGIGGDDYFSESYLQYQNVAVSLAARRFRVAGLEDLLPLSVAAFQNAHLILGSEFRSMAMRHKNYREYPQQVTQNRLLYSGRVDVVIGDRLIFHYLTRQLDKPLANGQAVVFHPIFPPSPRMAVFRDEDVRNAFNAGLRTIRRNGIYAAITRKYQAFLDP
ncbi:MAG TPA: transporter substrate-binding domain-containing protein [Noviherbaspirillum sp.]|jgi:polar amino acid transport system substrate-binding protein|uniref:substrate-binding periplasmic protein n=1 Tax=Noviherbaspirillum sp. TaxID=1926288 RepID=UPI002F93F68E